MSAGSIAANWSAWAPRLQSVLRIVAAFMFVLAGTMKLFAFPAGIPPDGGTVPVMSQMGLGAILEVLGGGLLLLGLFTRPVAFILAGPHALVGLRTWQAESRVPEPHPEACVFARSGEADRGRHASNRRRRE